MWKKFSEEKPPDDGPYLVYVSEINDLGKSEFINIANWNMQMAEPEFQDYSDDETLRKGAQVTHWMKMPLRPDLLGPERRCQLGVTYDEGNTWHKIDHADEIRGMKVDIPEDDTWGGPFKAKRMAEEALRLPPPPKPPAACIRREADDGPLCPVCKSSMHKKGWFRYGDHCISPGCDNYFGAYST